MCRDGGGRVAGVFERIGGTLAGKGGTGGAGDGPRSRGLYVETAADSENADVSVAVLLRPGCSSGHDRSGSVGLRSAAVEGREGSVV